MTVVGVSLKSAGVHMNGAIVNLPFSHDDHVSSVKIMSHCVSTSSVDILQKKKTRRSPFGRAALLTTDAVLVSSAALSFLSPLIRASANQTQILL